MNRDTAKLRIIKTFGHMTVVSAEWLRNNQLEKI